MTTVDGYRIISSMQEKRSESREIACRVANWLSDHGLTQIFGGNVYETEKNGKKYKGVDFCIPRRLDGTIRVYNKGFIFLNSTLHSPQTFKSEEELMEFLNEEFTS